MTDEIVDDVLEHLPPSECYALVQAVSAMETLQRGCLVLGIEHSPEEAWLTPAPAAASSTPEGNAR
jgi:hypothetical protein